MQPVHGFANATEDEEAHSKSIPQGFQVKVNGVSLVDLLQMFHLSRRSVTIKLSQGMLHIRDGEMIHAECGEVTGEDAVRKLLELRGGELQTESLFPTPVSVRRPLATVLLDALVSIDEHNGGYQEAAARLSGPPTLNADGPTRLAQLDAICADIDRYVEGAVCCVVADLKRRVLLGWDERTHLPEPAPEELLDVTLELFSDRSFAALECALENAPGEPSGLVCHTQEVYTHRGKHLYIGRRLHDDTAVLVVTTGVSLPALPMAQLRVVLSGGAKP